MAKFQSNDDMSSDQIFKEIHPYIDLAVRVVNVKFRKKEDPSLTTDFVTNFIDDPLRLLTLFLEAKERLAEASGINANDFEHIYRLPIAQQKALMKLQEQAQQHLCPPPSQKESPPPTNVNLQDVWTEIETLSHQLKRIYHNGENDASDKVPEKDDVLTEFSGHHLLDLQDPTDAAFLQDRENSEILRKLTHLYRLYDAATERNPAIAAEPETELKKRLKCWVGTKERFLTANSKFAGVLKKPESCSLLDKYFPQQQETPEDATLDASANNPEAPISGEDYIAPSPKTEKSKTLFGSVRQHVQKGINSAVNLGNTLANTLKPAATALVTAATALSNPHALSGTRP